MTLHGNVHGTPTNDNKHPVQKTRKQTLYQTAAGKRQIPHTHATHFQLDHIMTNKRWRNGILNVEADTEANIKSDHYPVWAKIRFKLQATRKKR